MPVDNGSFLPPNSRLRTVMTKIGTEITSKVEVVRYFLRLPDDETEDKAAYIEFEPPLTIENESLQSSQRSWMTFKVALYLYINESDTRILADFIDEITKVLYTPTAFTNFRDAFASGDGFSIERITIGEIGFGVEYCQCKLTLDILMHHPD